MPKYSVFWDASDVLGKLAAQPVLWHSVESVRGLLILVFRLLQLFRSVDLAQTWRSCSYAGTEMFVTVQRKGASKPAWEPLTEGGEPGLSPAHCARAYVALTAAHCPPGSPLLQSLKALYPPSRPTASGGSVNGC